MFSLNSLFKRTFFLITSSLILIVLLFNYSLIQGQKESLLNVMYSKARTESKSIALVSAEAMVTDDYSFIIEYTQKVLENNIDIVYIIVSEVDGTSIFSNKTKWSLMDELPESISKLQSHEEVGVIMQSDLSTEKVYHFSYPVVFSGVKWGWVTIGFSLDYFDATMNITYRNSILLILATLVASIMLSYVLAVWLVRPILSINEAAKKVASGDFNVKLDITNKDEIGELATSFRYMVSELKRSDNALRLSNEDLEARVAERTEALNSLNQDLDHRVKEEVSKRAEQEQMLIHQSRFAAMGEMIGNIAHQWRQPLNALSLLLQNIENAYEMEILDEAYISRTVQKGNQLTSSMSQTIDDFRNFFKPNKEASSFSVSQALNTTLNMLKSSLNHNLIEIDEEISSTVCVTGFSSEFSQVLLNIINNAKDALIEHRDENRRIGIRIVEDEEYVRIEIEDNAGGIPEDLTSKIFDPYYTTKEEGQGTGIGLYMSKTIIENNMKGILSVNNTSKGALFSIRLAISSCKGKSE